MAAPAAPEPVLAASHVRFASVLLDVVGDLLPLAAGVALSPIPIVAVVLVLSSSHARSTGPAFALGWVVGLAAVTSIVVVLASGADDPDSGSSTAVDLARIAAGVGLIFLAVKTWRGRPRDGEEPPIPAWMASIDSLNPAKGFVTGTALSGANPKNLVLAGAAGASIASAGLTGSETAVAVGVFVALASSTVVGAVVVNLVAAERSAAALASVKQFMLAHNAAIMMAILLLLGVKVLGDGISGLAG
jgi:threonine/homoserine/homoserine lactone efflux protein